jgi:glycosyltransferase involved in cell wall biosynthesis
MEPRVRKILFVGPFPPPFGGVAVHTQLLFESDLARRFIVTRLNLFRVANGGAPGVRARLARIKAASANLWSLSKALLLQKPDCVYLKMNGDRSCFREAVLMIAVRLLSSARIVLHFHGMFKPYPRNFPFTYRGRDSWIVRIIMNSVLGLAHRIVFLSPVILEEFKVVLTVSNFRKALAIEHFVLTREFTYRQVALSERRGARIIFVGRLTQDKGFYDLLAAIPAILQKFPETRFDVCGSAHVTQHPPDVVEQMQKLSKNDQVMFHGAVSGTQKSLLYRGADLMVFPSHHEVFPNVVLEALAQGLPLVTTRVGVVPSFLVENENCLYVSMADPSDIARTVVHLLERPELVARMSASNRRLAEERFDIKLAVDRLSGLFAE